MQVACYQLILEFCQLLVSLKLFFVHGREKSEGFLEKLKAQAKCLRSLYRFFQVFLRRREHQLDPVELVDFACTGVIIDRYDIGKRIALPKLFDNAFADNVVRQTSKGLRTDDIVDAAVDQFDHFTG